MPFKYTLSNPGGIVYKLCVSLLMNYAFDPPLHCDNADKHLIKLGLIRILSPYTSKLSTHSSNSSTTYELFLKHYINHLKKKVRIKYLK